MKLTLQSDLKGNFFFSGFVMSMNWCLNSFTQLWCQVALASFVHDLKQMSTITIYSYNHMSYYHNYAIQSWVSPVSFPAWSPWYPSLHLWGLFVGRWHICQFLKFFHISAGVSHTIPSESDRSVWLSVY